MDWDSDLKARVQSFWNAASCGEVYGAGASGAAFYEAQRKARYELEPYIFDFARFREGAGRDVLEIGVGMGADHEEWARAGPRSLHGVDMTPRAVEHTRRRFEEQNLVSDLRVADAEALPFKDGSFDIVYSWGVLHHTPDTAKAVREVYRVLRPKGVAKVMIYHRYSIVGYMLWLRYGLLRGHPARSLDAIYSEHLESPGTKAFSKQQARQIFADFSQVEVRVQLGPGDLLLGEVGQRHRGPLLSLAKWIWPRGIVRRCLPSQGLGLLVEALK